MAEPALSTSVSAPAEGDNESKSGGGSSYALAYARFPAPTTFDFFTERYYHQYLFEDCKKVPGNNVRVLQHSNGICVVCLDPSHIAIAAVKANPELRIASVVFGSGRNSHDIATGNVKVTGRKKKNAMLCQADMRICTVTLSDGTVYTIPTCLNGHLLELNPEVASHPWLAASAPMAEGFLAIISPSLRNDFSAMKKVWTATGGDAAGEDGD